MDNMDNFKNNSDNQTVNPTETPLNTAPSPAPLADTSTTNVDANLSPNPSNLNLLKKKKKRSKLFIILEVFLMLVVIFLILLFLNGSGVISLKFLNFYKSDIGTAISTKVSDSKNPITNVDSTGSAVIPGPPAAVTSGSREAMEIATSLRLSLPVPAQSPVSTEDQVPAGAVKVYGTEFGFEPFEFTVAAGSEVTLALVSQVDLPTILTFYDSNMPAISIGCGPRETRWLTFTAPDKPGEYIFKNDAIGRSNQTGRMIVN
jgi:hypothetical protein